MEERSHQTIRRVLPKEWVIRHYTPDYGVDIMVEIFETIDQSGSVAETLGEWFFAQVKSTNTTNLRKLTIRPRFNVEKVPASRSRTAQANNDESVEIDVISYDIDTDLLLTIQSFGVGVPILLLLVTLDTDTVYFVCLNDLVDKCILHEDGHYLAKKTKTLHIPATNVVTATEDALLPLRFFAKRQKLYAAFAKFSYQQHYVAEMIDRHSLRLDIMRVLKIREGHDQNRIQDAPLEAIDTIRQFLSIMKHYDFWTTTDMWKAIPFAHEAVHNLERELDLFLKTGNLADDDTTYAPDPDHSAVLLESKIAMTWNLLRNLSNLFEEICREWFLPTMLAHLTEAAARSADARD